MKQFENKQEDGTKINSVKSYYQFTRAARPNAIIDNE